MHKTAEKCIEMTSPNNAPLSDSPGGALAVKRWNLNAQNAKKCIQLASPENVTPLR